MQSLAGALREISEGNRQPVSASAAPLRRRKEGAMKSDKPGLFELCTIELLAPTSWALPGSGIKRGPFCPLALQSDILLILHWKMGRWTDEQWTDRENELLLV